MQSSIKMASADTVKTVNIQIPVQAPAEKPSIGYAEAFALGNPDKDDSSSDETNDDEQGSSNQTGVTQQRRIQNAKFEALSVPIATRYLIGSANLH